MAEEPPVMFTMDSALKIQRAVNTVSQWAGQTETPRNRNQGGYGAPVTLRVRNDSGDDRKRGEVLCIDEVVGSFIEDLPEQNRLIFLSGVAPDASNPRHSPCVLLEDIAANGYGDFESHGVAVAWVNILDETHAYARLIDGETQNLESSEYGPCLIQHVAAGTGRKLAVVHVGVRAKPIVVGKAMAAIAKGSSGTVQVYDGETKGGEAYTGRTITVWNRFGLIPTVTYGAWVAAASLGLGNASNEWDAIATECGPGSDGGGGSDCGGVADATCYEVTFSTSGGCNEIYNDTFSLSHNSGCEWSAGTLDISLVYDAEAGLWYLYAGTAATYSSEDFGESGGTFTVVETDGCEFAETVAVTTLACGGA